MKALIAAVLAGATLRTTEMPRRDAPAKKPAPDPKKRAKIKAARKQRSRK